MALLIDSTRALRTAPDLARLVTAVVDAGPEDESRAVEWKSGYDSLLTADASFAVARAILGLANRTVRAAQNAFEGVGYVIVGAEPGHLAGQAIPDSAELTQAISRYTGNGHPTWDGRAIDVDGKAVLVVTVESPREGDRIALLHRDHQGPKTFVPEGTVFVRRAGLTGRASRTELDALQDRLLDGAAGAEAERERLQAVRSTVLDGCRAAERWANTMQVIAIATASERWTERDWAEWVNTDSGRESREDAQLMKRSTANLRLRVTDADLLRTCAEADAELDDRSGFDGIHKTPSSGEGRSKAYQHINRVTAAWKRVEAEAIRLTAR